LSLWSTAGRDDALASFFLFQEYSVFVGNLPFDIEENDLRTWFSEYGTVNRVNVVLDPRTKRSKGTRIPSFASPPSLSFAVFAASQSTFEVWCTGHNVQFSRIRQGFFFFENI
jgi:RNA recognition motif-containing protein